MEFSHGVMFTELAKTFCEAIHQTKTEIYAVPNRTLDENIECLHTCFSDWSKLDANVLVSLTSSVNDVINVVLFLHPIFVGTAVLKIALMAIVILIPKHVLRRSRTS